MEKDTKIIYRSFEGFFLNGYKLDNIIIYDETGKEFLYNITCVETKILLFKFETNRRLKKNFSKRESFIFKDGTDLSGRTTYNLYIPAELVNFKYVGHKDNTTESGNIYHYYDYQFDGYVYNDKGLPVYKQKALNLVTLWMEETDELKYLKSLAAEINACSYGLKITPDELKDILKKFSITPRNEMSSTQMSTNV